MLSFGKNKRVVNIVIEDYVMRMVENNGEDLASIKHLKEKVLPLEMIEDGKIVDELKFFEFMKETVREWEIKGQYIRFYVPHSLVIMREIELPKNVHPDEIKQYITMEIGNTIHFPFKDPVFDLYTTDESDVTTKVTVMAAPEEEIMKYTEIFDDVKLKPLAVDVQALGVYRYFFSEYDSIDEEHVYLFLECNLTSTNISIFNRDLMEFLRFQPLNIPKEDWQPSGDEGPLNWSFTGDESHFMGEINDQLNELERIMSFYQFSIHQGDKSVTDIIVLGDVPIMDHIVSTLQERYTTPVIPLTTGHLLSEVPVRTDFIPALGLALKGDVK